MFVSTPQKNNRHCSVPILLNIIVTPCVTIVAMRPSTLLRTLVVLAKLSAAAYVLQEDYGNSASFFDHFDFFTVSSHYSMQIWTIILICNAICTTMRCPCSSVSPGRRSYTRIRHLRRPRHRNKCRSHLGVWWLRLHGCGLHQRRFWQRTSKRPPNQQEQLQTWPPYCGYLPYAW